MKRFASEMYSEDQVMMTLSAIAYTSFDSIATLQNNLDAAEALEQNYNVLWLARNDTSLVYVVKNWMKDEYSIAIRGPKLRFDLPLLVELYHDMEIDRQVPLSYNKMGGAKIAAGILDTLQKLNQLTCDGKTLSQLINGFRRGAKIYITGHGLGGTLAAALAVDQMGCNLGCRDIIPYTFAALSAGNHAFADLFNLDSEYCLFSYSSNCASSLDIIPYAWHNVHAIRTVDYEKTRCPPDLGLCIDFISRLLLISRVPYALPVRRLDLRGGVGRKDGFFLEAMYQHQPNKYLALLELEPLPITAACTSRQRQGRAVAVHPFNQ
jgi:hypothetical protein